MRAFEMYRLAILGMLAVIGANLGGKLSDQTEGPRLLLALCVFDAFVIICGMMFEAPGLFSVKYTKKRGNIIYAIGDYVFLAIGVLILWQVLKPIFQQ